MIDAVLGYHMNPLTCGIAKFNHQLATRLGVPCMPLDAQTRYRHPLISIKASEVERPIDFHVPFDVLWHDAGNERISNLATRIFYASETGIPATLIGNPTRGTYRVLTFGMAHKRLLLHYEALKVQLDAEHPDYTVEMSTAIHEGHPWEDGLEQSVRDMRGIFGDKLRVLGFLGDDALAKELQDCDAVAVYFTPAFRANNTTAWAAIDAGKRLYTNRDEHSPPYNFDHSWDKLTALLCAR